MTAPSSPAAHSVIIERELPHPPQKVWRVLTEGSLIDQWLLKSNFQPVVGHRFNFQGPKMQDWDGIIQCQVLAADPTSRLSYTWSALGLNTTVTFTLTPTTAGTHLRMEQSGFPSNQGPYYKGAFYGWTSFLGKLDQLLATVA